MLNKKIIMVCLIVGLAIINSYANQKESSDAFKGNETAKKEKQLIIGIDSDKLFERIFPDLKVERQPLPVDVGFNGINYSLVDKDEKKKDEIRVMLLMAVWTDEVMAREQIKKQVMMISVGPTNVVNSFEVAPGIGYSTNKLEEPFADELYYWASKKQGGGSILFRRLNSVFYLTGDIDKLAIARKIDEFLVTLDEVAKKGKEVKIPKIKDETLPKTAVISSTLTFSLETEDSDMTNIIIGADYRSNIFVDKNNKITYRAPQKAGEDVISLIIASKNNVIYIKKWSISVVLNEKSK